MWLLMFHLCSSTWPESHARADYPRFHPETPIINPGGVLRAMTQRHAAGKLNIVGSLIGLSERERADNG